MDPLTHCCQRGHRIITYPALLFLLISSCDGFGQWHKIQQQYPTRTLLVCGRNSPTFIPFECHYHHRRKRPKPTIGKKWRLSMTGRDNEGVRTAAATTAANEETEKAIVDDEEEEEEEDFVNADDGDALQTLFSSNCDEDGLMTKVVLRSVSGISELLDDGDLLQEEFDEIWNKAPKFPTMIEESNSQDRIDVDSFIQIYRDIDDLFEDVDDDEEDEDVVVDESEEEEEEEDDEDVNNEGSVDETAPLNDQSLEMEEENLIEQEEDVPALSKNQLLTYLSEIGSDEERLPCGLEATEREESIVLDIVTSLEMEPSNLVRSSGGDIGQKDIAGEWDLLYSSSSAMKFNKGLSGLGGSFPNGKFGGLIQKLQCSKFMSDIEYVERIIVNPGGNSFDVIVNGDWNVKSSMSLFTGEPSIMMSVEPEYVTYGPTKTRADHWKSLGPLNILDITYLDEDLRVMRGTTSTESIFIFRRR